MISDYELVSVFMESVAHLLLKPHLEFEVLHLASALKSFISKNIIPISTIYAIIILSVGQKKYFL